MRAKNTPKFKESLLGLIDAAKYSFSEFETYIRITDEKDIDLDAFTDMSDTLIKIQNYIKFNLKDI